MNRGRPPQPYSQAVRAIRLLRALECAPWTEPRIRVEVLTARFGVTHRSLRRDVAALVSAGEPIVMRGGFVWYGDAATSTPPVD
jgi:predicted DNA-binding transcriptional regulator YafY